MPDEDSGLGIGAEYEEAVQLQSRAGTGEARLRLGCAGGRLGSSSSVFDARPAVAGAAAMSQVPPAPTELRQLRDNRSYWDKRLARIEPADAMMEPMAATPPPLVTREALRAFTQRLVDHFAPEKVILFGSQARGEARWDSDADILVVMPFEGNSLEQRLAMLQVGDPSFPVDLLLCRPEAAAQRYSWGDPFIREAFDHGEVLHG